MTKTDSLLDAISSALECHLGGDVKRNAHSVTGMRGADRVIVRIKTKKAKAKTVAAKAKRAAKKAAA